MKSQLGRRRARGLFTAAVLTLGLPFVNPVPIAAQGPALSKPPNEVLEAFLKMDADGGRLTVEGWYRASPYFVKPGPAPQEHVMEVIEAERVTGSDPWFKGGPNRLALGVICKALGQVDSSGRFISVTFPMLNASAEHDYSGPVKGYPQIHGPHFPGRSYVLVLSDTHWEFGPERKDLLEVKGQPEWRIENFEWEPWVTTEAAIRYLTRLRDESSSEIIKRNAAQSIATLGRLPKE